MPGYYFHIHDGVDTPDREGTVLSGRDAARVEALSLAGEIIRDAGRRADFGDEWRLIVTDDTGLTLFIMAFSVAESPAMVRQR